MGKIATKLYDGSTLTIVAPTNCNSGQPLQFGGGYVVPVTTAKLGELVAVYPSGVFTIAAATSDTISLGTTLYYDENNKQVTTDDDDGKRCKIGHACSEKAKDVPGNVDVSLDISGSYTAPEPL